MFRVLDWRYMESGWEWLGMAGDGWGWLGMAEVSLIAQMNTQRECVDHVGSFMVI